MAPAAAVAAVPVLGRRALVAGLGAVAIAAPVAVRPAAAQVSVTVSAAAVPVAPDRRRAFALAALRAVPDVVCRRASVVTSSSPEPTQTVLVEGEATTTTGLPLRLVQWLWWRPDGRTVRVLLIADIDRVASARAAVAATQARG